MDNSLTDAITSKNHLVRKLERELDFTFIVDEIGDLYNPDLSYIVSPEYIARYMLLIHLFSLDRPMRINQTKEEKINDQMIDNAPYRWFLKSELGDPMPEYNRVMKSRSDFGDDEKWESIFNNLLQQCADKGLPYKKNGAWDNIDMWQ